MKVADDEDAGSDGVENEANREPRETRETIPSEEAGTKAGKTLDEEPAAPPGPEGLSEEIKELRKRAAERDEYLELAQRLKADFVNYQKRMEGERRKWAAVAQRDLLAGLLTACDQCSVAAKSAEGDSSVESLRNAIVLVWSELEKFLKEAGVSQVPTVGARFDPDVHEAVFAQASEEHPDSTVLDEVKPGYLHGDQVLRPAQVVVTKRPAAEDAAAEEEKGRDELDEGRDEGDNSGDEQEARRRQSDRQDTKNDEW